MFGCGKKEEPRAASLPTVAAQVVPPKPKVTVLLGHVASQAGRNNADRMAVAELNSKAGIPQIFGSATRTKHTHNGFATTFRIMTGDIQQCRLLGDYAVKQMAAQTAAIVDDRSAYGKGIADEF